MDMIEAEIQTGIISVKKRGAFYLASGVFKNLRTVFGYDQGRLRKAKILVGATDDVDEAFAPTKGTSNRVRVFSESGRFARAIYYSSDVGPFWPIALCENGLKRLFGKLPKYLTVEWLS